MPGRVKRKLQAAQMQDAAERREQRVAPVCALCERPLGTRVEWHHLVPKSEGGTVTVPVHPICHRAIHAHVSNRSLATEFAKIAALREREDLQRFLKWIAGKPADFHAPTGRKRTES